MATMMGATLLNISFSFMKLMAHHFNWPQKAI
jgi:hypothetical protein